MKGSYESHKEFTIDDLKVGILVEILTKHNVLLDRAFLVDNNEIITLSEEFEDIFSDVEVTASCNYVQGSMYGAPEDCYEEESSVDDLTVTILIDKKFIDITDALLPKALKSLEGDVFSEWYDDERQAYKDHKEDYYEED